MSSSWAALKARAGALAPSMSKVTDDERNGDDERKPLKFAVQDSLESDHGHPPNIEAGAAGSVAEKRLCGLPVPVLAGLAYCTASASMVLLNKLALSSFDFRSITMLLLFQCIFCVVAVYGTSLLGLIRLEPWSWDVACTWFPVNVIFVGMIWTSFPALQLLGVGMVTVLKNLTNLFTISGDIMFFGKRYNMGVWATLVLMTVSALCGAATDLQFNPKGYMWQLINCLFTAAYALTLRNVMDKVAPLTANKRKLDEFSMVLYNNVLSIPMLLLAAGVNGEFATIASEPALHNPRFQAAACLSAICGFMISFCSLWFLSTTTATTYSLVGSLNKMPIALLGLLFFDSTWDAKNVASIGVGLAAGVVFVRAKQSSS